MTTLTKKDEAESVGAARGSPEDFRRVLLQSWCDTLHCHVTGSGDSLTDERAAAIAGYIKQRINDWHDTEAPWSFYDNAVKHLCLMTLLEFDRTQPICPVCHGTRATYADILRSHDKTLPDEEQQWELALCWAAQDGSHARASAASSAGGAP